MFFIGTRFISTELSSACAQGTTVPDDLLADVAPLDGAHRPDRRLRKTVNLSGPIWYENGSGVSFAKGMGQPDGRFALTVTTMNGDGPAGTITGQRMPDGSIDATAEGPLLWGDGSSGSRTDLCQNVSRGHACKKQNSMTQHSILEMRHRRTNAIRACLQSI